MKEQYGFSHERAAKELRRRIAKHKSNQKPSEVLRPNAAGGGPGADPGQAAPHRPL